MLQHHRCKRKFHNNAGIPKSFQERTADIGEKDTVALNGKCNVWEGRQVSRFGNPKEGNKVRCDWKGQPGFVQTKTQPNHKQQ